MDNTSTIQGSFVSTGLPITLQMPAGFDWIRVYNYTQAGTSDSANGVEYYWQDAMAQGSGLVYSLNGSGLLGANTMSSGGFSYIDTSGNPVGALNTTVSAVSNASTPVVSASSTLGLANGSVVRMFNVAGAQQLGGIDFTIGSIDTNSHFTLAYMSQIVAGTTGSFRPIAFDPYFYPTHRYISAITQASSAVVTMTVTHGYTVGQEVRLVVPAAYGMVEANGLQGQISAINTSTNTITLNIDSSGFTAFAFPLSAAVPFSPAMVIPIGEGTDSTIANPNLLDDATVNTAFIGVTLGVATTLLPSGTGVGPAGTEGDVVYWQAGTVFSTTP